MQHGEQGIQKLCDQQTVQKIQNRDDSIFLKELKNKTNPCKTYHLPYQLAFNYLYYMRDLNKAQKYFMLAALHHDAPPIASQMPAIIQTRGGDHQLAALMRIERYANTENSEFQQKFLYKSIQELSLHFLQKNKNITSSQIKENIQTMLEQCKQNQKENDPLCRVLQQGIEQKFIQPQNGKLLYPFAPETTTYQRDSQYQDRWIGKTNTKTVK